MRTTFASFLAFVVALSLATGAGAITIDSFEAGQNALEDTTPGSGSLTETASGPASEIIGGEREVTIDLTSGSSIRADLNPDLPDLVDDGLTFTLAAGSTGMLGLRYGVATPLGVDLTAGGHSVIAVGFGSGTVDGILEVELDDGLNVGTQAVPVSGGSGLYKNLPLELFPTVDVSSIQRIFLTLTADNSAGPGPVSLTLNDVRTAVPEPSALQLVGTGLLLILAFRRR